MVANHGLSDGPITAQIAECISLYSGHELTLHCLPFGRAQLKKTSTRLCPTLENYLSVIV